MLLISKVMQQCITSKVPSVLLFYDYQMLMTEKDILRAPGIKVMDNVKN